MKTLDLNKDTKMTVASPNGGINHLIVKGGEVRYDETSCPDKVCVHQGKKHLDSNTIVCLPNQMIVTVAGGE